MQTRDIIQVIAVENQAVHRKVNHQAAHRKVNHQAVHRKVNHQAVHQKVNHQAVHQKEGRLVVLRVGVPLAKQQVREGQF